MIDGFAYHWLAYLHPWSMICPCGGSKQSRTDRKQRRKSSEPAQQEDFNNDDIMNMVKSENLKEESLRNLDNDLWKDTQNEVAIYNAEKVADE